MKKAIALLLAAALCGMCSGVTAEVLSRPLPGMDRAEPLKDCRRSADLAAEKGVELTDGYPLYTPADPQPLNAYLVTYPGCMYSTNHELLSVDGAEDREWKGWFRPTLKDWMEDIIDMSHSGIRFVKDPDQAEILVSVMQYFDKSGTYQNQSDLSIVNGYACYLSISARSLTDGRSVGVSFSYIPGDSEKAPGGGDFWMLPASIRNTEELRTLTGTIMGWYGFEGEQGRDPEGLKRFQQALIDRGFMEGEATGVYDGNTSRAVLLLEKLYRLPENDAIDEEVLTAAYYNRTSHYGWGFRYMPINMKEPSVSWPDPTEPENARRGDVILLGRYEQDADDDNGPDPIRWAVLAREDDRLLVASVNVLDYLKFDEAGTSDTWDNCSLRTWLNSDFLQTAFTEEEQRRILLSDVAADPNERYGERNQGDETQDRVFLLSLREAQAGFGDDLPSSADYTRMALVYRSNVLNWWTRTAGAPGCVACGNGKGFNDIGDKISPFGYAGVRPAMWILAGGAD